MSKPQEITYIDEEGNEFTLYLPTDQNTSEPYRSAQGTSRGLVDPDSPAESYSPFPRRTKHPSIPPDLPAPPGPIQLAQIHKILRGYAEYAIGAFRNLSSAEVDEMNLKFGIKINGQTGLPMLAQSGIEGDFQIEVKCKFPKTEPERSDHPGK